LFAWAAGPLLNKVVDCLPSAQIEVANAEIGAVSDLQRRTQYRQKLKLDIVKDARHGASSLHEGNRWHLGPDPGAHRVQRGACLGERPHDPVCRGKQTVDIGAYKIFGFLRHSGSSSETERYHLGRTSTIGIDVLGHGDL